MKPERHFWTEDTTHRIVADKKYDEVWDYAEQLEAENARLREALYGEYCDCGMKNATIRIGTHTYMCKYFTVMNRILSQKAQSDEIEALEGVE